MYVKELFSKFYEKIYSKIPLKFDFLSELNMALFNCKTILDVGCGSDSPLQYCKNEIYCVGVDLFDPSIDKSKERKIHNEYYKLNALDIKKKFEENSFDCVIALDLIEHLTKKEGNILISSMEKIAKKKIIIFTTNGFIPQRITDNNPWQIHKSGWTVEEMRQKDYNVIGINGWKFLIGEYGLLRYKPHFFWFLISKISQLFVRNYPKKAAQLLCIKEKKSS